MNFAGECIDRLADECLAPALVPASDEVAACSCATDLPRRLTSGTADVYYHPLLRPAQWRHVLFGRGRQGRMARLMMVDPYVLASSLRPACRTVWQFLNRHLLRRRINRVY